MMDFTATPRQLVLLLITACSLVFSASPLVAQEIELDEGQQQLGQAGQYGLGLGGGLLTSGLTGKYYLADYQAIQAHIGFWGASGYSFGADYLLEFGPLTDVEPGTLHWSAGGGVSAVIYTGRVVRNSTLFGASGIVGLTWHFKDIPIELTAELRPTILFGDFIGGFHFGTGGAIRWYFL